MQMDIKDDRECVRTGSKEGVCASALASSC
jgi:hypothetical protein